ncbi:MAG TPA: 23S rRNA (pseudouridine(1915)-N(3))-methyltransferase RlmH [Gammaproteobacteria bacterium]|nr:23S rRNA (pseudouridine(1915)-N(3))-methyltransferase RlmH [Acidiferrobacteraceae bacterium]MDP6551898.1 23S rRNA (pseudouridine(1915)-N(3))-methyltransferase RlmH [Arenicellales bacterium]MDP6791377.1 23S rRNA (pseudouridine(1915)-N(3))-methyltransferase RlmH [Arenicellales bacterium]MDP6919302.1 23S rRNA (pseudouridine(1915)-N(3))-methyltransferase RlmH [Arenicellales bacterium]HCX88228.1 23S rRNA (pseudouridine(1915)-N(3))-methyltransferase RlmH [Gammaproteobacteria bacterium]
MWIHLVAVGRRMPSWISDGFSEYAQRLRCGVQLELIEVDTPRRGQNADLSRIVREEGTRLLQAAPAGSYRIALDQSGRSYDSESLALQLEKWMHRGRDIALLVGGPDGLSDQVLESADQCWSLSPLTLAHPLVRVVIAEQLFRAYAISRGLPYHRPGRVS